MVQLNQVPKLEYAGSADEQELAQRIFTLLRAQGHTMAARTAIRQSLTNLAQYLAEQKYKGLDSAEAVAPLVDKALSANPAIFLRQEDNGEVTFKTTKAGVAPSPDPVVYDHHSYKTRLFEGARPVEQLSEEEIAAKAAEAQAHSQAFAIPLPFAATESKQVAPVAPVVIPPVVVTPPRAVAKTPIEQTPVKSAPVTPVVKPAEPAQPVVVEAKPEPAQPVVVAPQPPVVKPPAPVVPSVPVIIEVADGVTVDLNQPVADILASHGDYFASALQTIVEEDFRFVNFVNDWYLDESTGRFSKGEFRRVRDYMNEVQGPVSDEAILSDVFNKRKSEHDYEATRFALNFRLLKEKKDFEFVGAEDDRVWSAPGLPAIGQGHRKASEVGVDYKFLEDLNLADPSEVQVEKGRKQWDHIITFYEYENGVLPYDSSAKELFPGPLMDDQKALILRFEAPQLYFTYTAELRYSTGARGGWIAGLEQFFADNLIPGAKLLLTQGTKSNHFLIEYEVDNEQERRLLFYDERRQKFVYRTIAFACKVDDNQILTPERFGKLDNQKRLEESDRRKTDLLVANAFELVGTKVGDLLRASLDDLYPLVNIERPFSRAYLRSLLTQGNSAFRPEGTTPDTYTYKIGAVKK